MNRTAFTMIELIFVIVVVSILATIAITRLSAVRQDAFATTTIADFNKGIKTIVTKANGTGNISDISTIVPETSGITTTANTITATINGTVCSVGQISANNSLVVTINSSTGDCKIFSGMAGKTYELHGSGITR
jgi:general secretion pathway protein G